MQYGDVIFKYFSVSIFVRMPHSDASKKSQVLSILASFSQPKIGI